MKQEERGIRMVEIRCDRCGKLLSDIRRGLTGTYIETINECHCPKCHPENFEKVKKRFVYWECTKCGSILKYPICNCGGETIKREEEIEEIADD